MAITEVLPITSRSVTATRRTPRMPRRTDGIHASNDAAHAGCHFRLTIWDGEHAGTAGILAVPRTRTVQSWHFINRFIPH
jgi:hypothetical protein